MCFEEKNMMASKLSRPFAELLCLLVLYLFFAGMNSGTIPDGPKNVYKVSTNDLRDHIDINQIDMLFYNNGIGSYNNSGSGTSGLYWPKGSLKTAIFEDGLVFGGKVDGNEIRVGGSTYRAGLQAGPIVNGVPADPSDSRYKIYKIKKGWETFLPGTERDQLQSDYENWPGDLGAPFEDVNGNGVWDKGIDKPQFIGDEVDFMVMNDGDPARTAFLYGTQPMGIEVQCTIFGFNRTGDLGNMVFKKYRLINKGSHTINDMVLAQWSDPDLGSADDDYVGCDTVRTLGYCYNGDNDDGGGIGSTYGTPPPAVGYDFFQGPVIPYDPVKYPIINQRHLPDSAKFGGKWIHGKTNLPLTSFSLYVNSGSVWLSDPDLGSALGSQQMYWYMTSHDKIGNPFLDPTRANKPVAYCLYGDPVAKTGWYEGAGWPGGQAPGDRRMLMSSGSFTFAPGDTQEIVVGIVIAKGTDNLNSVTVLKSIDDVAQRAYNLDFKLVQTPSAPIVKYAALDKKINLYWEPNTESYEVFDPLLGGKYLLDSTYNFEGYMVYQYQDASGSSPQLIATYDIVNGVTKILDYVYVQGENVLLPVAGGSDIGIRRNIEIDKDYYTNKPLENGESYYFGVIAYGYCPNGSPKILTSPITPINISPRTVFPTDFSYYLGDIIPVTQSGLSISDGIAVVKVIDPLALTGRDYEVFMSNSGSSMTWNLRDVTKGDTLLKNMPFDTININSYAVNGFDFTLNAKIVDGFVIHVGNPLGTTKIKEVVMTSNGGVPVTPTGNIVPFVPRTGENVFGSGSASSIPPTTSARKWWFAAIDQLTRSSSMQVLNSDGNAGVKDFEITFTDTSGGSGFYTWSNLRLIGTTATGRTKTNPVGYNRIPFQVKDISTGRRLYVKVFDDTLGTEGIRGTNGRRLLDSTWTGTYVNKQSTVADSALYEEFSFWEDTLAYTDPVLGMAKCRSTSIMEYPISKLSIATKVLGDIPTPNTVIRINTWKPITIDNLFKFKATASTNKIVILNNIIKLEQNYPNPFNPSTTISYQIPNESFVSIKLYDVLGREIKTLVSETLKAGTHTTKFDGANFPSGIYIVKMTSGAFTQSRKIILMK